MTSVPMVPLSVETAFEGPTACLALDGELTYATVPVFTAHVTEVLGALRSRLVLDVTRLQFCDSIGLSALIGAQRQAELHGGGVALSGVHGSLARSLSVTGAGVLFDVDDRAGAGTPAPDTSGYAGEPA